MAHVDWMIKGPKIASCNCCSVTVASPPRGGTTGSPTTFRAAATCGGSSTGAGCAAAWSTSASYATMSILLLVLVQRFYRVPYEWYRVGLVSLAAAVSFSIWYLQPVVQVFFNEALLLISFSAIAAALTFLKRPNPIPVPDRPGR